jgi:hypothetical protein
MVMVLVVLLPGAEMGLVQVLLGTFALLGLQFVVVELQVKAWKMQEIQ